MTTASLPQTDQPEPRGGADTAPADGLLPTLAGHYYTDPDIFRAEQSAIFESSWMCVARTAELAKPGAFRTVPVGRESVLLVRSRSGALNAFLNVCRHRGARLCTEESGELRRNLRCPYHAWTYSLDGELTQAPNLSGMPSLDRSEYGLRPVALREWLGYAWVCLAQQPPSFEETVVGEAAARLGGEEVLDHYGVEELALGKRINYDVAANWKLIVENFMECYHCATIHPELTEVLPEFADGYAAQWYVGHGPGFAEEAEGFTVDGTAGFDRLPGVPDTHDRRYYAITVRPQVFLNLVPDHVILHRMFPLAEDRTLVECDWLYAPGVLESGADLSHSIELFHRVNEQDFAACERTQPAMSSSGYRDGGVLVPSEHHISEFHGWVTERLGGACARPSGRIHPSAGPRPALPTGSPRCLRWVHAGFTPSPGPPPLPSPARASLSRSVPARFPLLAPLLTSAPYCPKAPCRHGPISANVPPSTP